MVVGVDGSAASWQAVHAAAWEAKHRGTRLVLAHGYPADPYTWFGWAPAYAGPAFDPHMAAWSDAEMSAWAPGPTNSSVSTVRSG